MCVRVYARARALARARVECGEHARVYRRPLFVPRLSRRSYVYLGALNRVLETRHHGDYHTRRRKVLVRVFTYDGHTVVWDKRRPHPYVLAHRRDKVATRGLARVARL